MDIDTHTYACTYADMFPTYTYTLHAKTHRYIETYIDT